MTPMQLAVRDTTAASMLGIDVEEFRRVVSAGALPGPILIGDVKRWNAAHIECIAKGYARRWREVFDESESWNWGDLLSIFEGDRRPYRYVSPHLRAEIFKRDGEKCQYCGTTSGPFHIDHIHPVSRGGGSDRSNLCVSCATCNLSKRDKTLEEWRAVSHD